MIIRFSILTRLFPHSGVRRDSSCDDENAMMSVIEEVPEESDSLIENTGHPTRRTSDDLSSASSSTEDSSNTG